MFCKDLTLHIVTISILSCIFLLCGAEVDAKLNDVYEDDYDIIRNATKEQLNSSVSYIPSFVPSYSTGKRPYSSGEVIIYVVIAIVVCIVVISIKCCCKYLKDQIEDVEDVVVHPPPAQGQTVFLPPTGPVHPFRAPNRESVVLPPNDAFPVFVPVYNPTYRHATHNTENVTVQEEDEHGNTNPSMDLPPSYESVVNSDKERNTAHQFPTVSKQAPTAPDIEKY